ncbi:MAG: DNA internalization-related competence protein ComEC/Rec2 [Blastocatellia bacterium]|nr:DNA internalization-related competence protein ComEC/Rec2 [Blastocatellia bacterium]
MKADSCQKGSLQPALYLFASFACGITAGKLLTESLQPKMWQVVVILLLVLVTAFLKRIDQQVATALILLAFLIGGVFVYQLQKRSEIEASHLLVKIEDRLDMEASREIEIFAKVIRPPVSARGRVYIDIELHYIALRTGVIDCRSKKAKLVLWLKDQVELVKYQQESLSIGDHIHALAKIQAEQYHNPGVFDAKTWEQEYLLTISIGRLELLEVLVNCQPTAIEKLQQYINREIEQSFTEESMGLLKASILGNGHFLTDAIDDRFRRSGTYHILVISGSHIALLALIIDYFLRLITKHRASRLVIIGLCLWGYALLTGLQPPVFRAVLMSSFLLFGLLIWRKVAAGNFLGLSGLLILAIDPKVLFGASFQLTFIAVAVILLLVLPLMQRVEAIGRWQPSRKTPYPPNCSRQVKWLAELLYWSGSRFASEMAESPIKYRLEKNKWALHLERYGLQKPLRYIFLLLTTSTFVQLALLPLSIYYFNRVSPIGIFLNITAEVMMTLLLALFLIFSIIGTLIPWLVPVVASLVELFCNLFVMVASTSSTNWITSFRIAHFSGVFQLFYIIYELFFLALMVFVGRWNPLQLRRSSLGLATKISLGIATLLFLIILLPVKTEKLLGTASTSKDKLSLSFLDVGQGDAIFIKFPSGKSMLIDAGGSFFKGSFSVGEQVVSRYLWWRSVEELDYVVATHSDLDHIQGLSDVIENFRVKTAVVSGFAQEDPNLEDFKKKAAEYGIKLSIWSQGESFEIDGVKIDILWPSRNSFARLDNNCSLVMRLIYGEKVFLLTGDIEKEAEKFILKSVSALESDLLKVPHHGSRTSSSEEFLKAVSPKIAIISAPKWSRFNHPHSEVVERYCQKGVKVYQTGISGTIDVVTDGKSLQVKEFMEKGRHCR